jgi:hypothetical protein
MNVPLRRITEVPCECPACGWSGLTGNTEPDVDGDGSLGCPRCHTIVTIHYLPHEKGSNVV